MAVECKRGAVITMGQAQDKETYRDINAMFISKELQIIGILDGMTLDDVKREAWPVGDEGFIVSNIADGTNVRIAERVTISRVKDSIKRLEKEGMSAALILCTGHFDMVETSMTLLIPERIIFSLLDALGVKRLGAIVPEPEQIPMSQEYYARYNPVIRAASPYGSREAIKKTAAMFADEQVDLILTDCMGFTAEMGEDISQASGKRIFVPRVVLPTLMNSLL